MNYLLNFGTRLYSWHNTLGCFSATSPQQIQGPFIALPDELKIKILKYCDQETILKVSECSQALFHLTSDNVLWQPYAAKCGIDGLNLRVNLRGQIKDRYIHLKEFLLATDCYEKASYKGMIEILTEILDPSKDPEIPLIDVRYHKRQTSRNNFEAIVETIHSADNTEEFIKKVEVFLLILSCHHYELAGGWMCRLFPRFKFLCVKDKDLNTARLVHAIIRSGIVNNYNLIFEHLSPSFIRPLIEVLEWKPTTEVYKALIHRFGKSDSLPLYKDIFDQFKQHGFVPSYDDLEHAVRNYSLEKFKLLLSFNRELISNRGILQIAVKYHNVEVSKYLLETIPPNLDVLKEALKSSVYLKKGEPSIEIMILILEKGLDPQDCDTFLHDALPHFFGRGVLNDLVKECNLVRVEKLLSHVCPELLTLQIALRKTIIDKNPNAIGIVRLLLEKANISKMHGVREANGWLQNITEIEKWNFK